MTAVPHPGFPLLWVDLTPTYTPAWFFVIGCGWSKAVVADEAGELAVIYRRLPRDPQHQLVVTRTGIVTHGQDLLSPVDAERLAAVLEDAVAEHRVRFGGLS